MYFRACKFLGVAIAGKETQWLQPRSRHTFEEAEWKLTMMGMSDRMTGTGVAWPMMIHPNRQLNAGSRVFTVWVKEIATAAKDTLAAMWPMACIMAGPLIFLHSFPLMACAPRHTRSQGSQMSSQKKLAGRKNASAQKASSSFLSPDPEDGAASEHQAAKGQMLRPTLIDSRSIPVKGCCACRHIR